MEHGDELEKDAEDGWVETLNPTKITEKKAIAFDDDDEEVKAQEVVDEKK